MLDMCNFAHQEVRCNLQYLIEKLFSIFFYINSKCKFVHNYIRMLGKTIHSLVILENMQCRLETLHITDLLCGRLCAKPMMRQLNTSIGRWTLLPRQQSIVPTSTLFFWDSFTSSPSPFIGKVKLHRRRGYDGRNVFHLFFYLFCNVSKKSLQSKYSC